MTPCIPVKTLQGRVRVLHSFFMYGLKTIDDEDDVELLWDLCINSK